MNTNMKKRNALVLDDDIQIQDLVRMVLELQDYHVFSYCSPIESPHFTRIVRHPSTNRCADLIITDIVMPEMTGIEFVKQIRKDECSIKHIAIISGYWDDTAMAEAKSMNCKTFEKPFDLIELQEWIKSLEY